LPGRTLPTLEVVGWRACATFTVALALLLAPWPGLGATCARAFAFIYNLLGVDRVLDSGLSIHLEPVGEAFQQQIPTSPLWHVFLRATSGAHGGGPRMAFDTRGAFYLPAATFLAFLLAARVWRWKRARRAVLAGTLVLIAFTTLSVVVASVSFLAMPAVGGITLGASSRLWLETLFLGWFAAPGMGYAAALLAAACAWLGAHGLEAPFMANRL
jgi:hypothetical protein